MPDIILNESDQNLFKMKDEIESAGSYLEAVMDLIKRIPDSVSITESAIFESSLEQLKEKALPKSYMEDELEAVPWFTPDEVNGEADTSDILISDPYKYINTIKMLQQDVEKNKETILNLRWNPYVQMTETTLKYARNKQIKWLNENRAITIVDLTRVPVLEDNKWKDYKGPLEPVFIVLSYTGTFFGNIINWYKKSHYSHAALSMDSSLKQLWSYNRTPDGKVDGLSIESIDEYQNKKANNDADLYVMAVFVPKKVKKKIKDVLEWYKANVKRTKYNFKNIAMIVMNKTHDTLYSLNMVCSQFVDNVLKIANVDITNKSNNLVSPQDFVYTASNENKVYALYEGLKSKYNKTEIDQKVKNILSSLNHARNIHKTAKQLKTAMTMEDFMLGCVDNTFIDSILEDAREFIKPTSILTEKRVPVGFTYKGDFYIDGKKSLEREYQEAHKLLSMYTIDNMNGIKHELARLFFVVTSIEKKCTKIKKTDPEYKDLIKLKARAMNDFTKYMKLVTAEDKNFDFQQYMKSSEYYDKTILIGRDTFKFSGQYIKKAMKLFS